MGFEFTDEDDGALFDCMLMLMVADLSPLTLTRLSTVHAVGRRDLTLPHAALGNADRLAPAIVRAATEDVTPTGEVPPTCNDPIQFYHCQQWHCHLHPNRRCHSTHQPAS